MKTLYHITGLCPRTDIPLGRCGFCIQLWPKWKDAIAESGLTQEHVNTLVKNMHRPWLDGCGFDAIFDPERGPRDEWESKYTGKPIKYSKHAHPLYDQHSVRIQWGEWGPEHLTVPGNACGLDIDRGLGPPGGRVLVPHNIDSLNQVVLLLVVFTSIAEFVILGGVK